MTDELITATPHGRTILVREIGQGIGFDDVRIALPGPHPEMDLFDEWLEREYHGEMHYMFRHRRRRRDINLTMDGVKSVIVATLSYDTEHPRSSDIPSNPEEGWISRYAWGDDYHNVIEPMLDQWVEALAQRAPEHQFKHYVDHGPVLEKVYAKHAGIGWQGKNTNIIHPERGSFFFLAVILTDLELRPDEPIPDYCGTCTACLDACPTQAFVAPYILDSRRCISYLTIEIKGEVPPEFHQAIGDHVFGCDVCQDVCPWNRKPLPLDRDWSQPREGNFRPKLTDLINMSQTEFSEKFKGSPLKRRGLDGVKHTAEIVMNNHAMGDAKPGGARGADE